MYESLYNLIFSNSVDMERLVRNSSPVKRVLKAGRRMRYRTSFAFPDLPTVGFILLMLSSLYPPSLAGWLCRYASIVATEWAAVWQKAPAIGAIPRGRLHCFDEVLKLSDENERRMRQRIRVGLSRSATRRRKMTRYVVSAVVLIAVTTTLMVFNISSSASSATIADRFFESYPLETVSRSSSETGNDAVQLMEV